MPIAEIIAIGTELLLGEIQDTNTRFLARELRNVGVDLYRASMVGDNVDRIAQSIREALSRADIVITTGGLGPTVDDPTRAAVAKAVSVDLVFLPEAWSQIEDRFKRYDRVPTENNRRQAYIPAGAILVANPVGTAPAFIYEFGQKSIISVPGVPREMEYLLEHAVLPYLQEHFHLHEVIQATVFHTSGIGESMLDELVADLEAWTNPTLGLNAHPGSVDLRITAKASSMDEARQLIEKMAAILRQRVGDAIYGQDDISLVQAVHLEFAKRGWRLAVVESGLSGTLIRHLAQAGFSSEYLTITSTTDPEKLRSETMKLSADSSPQVSAAVLYQPGADQQLLDLYITAAEKTFHKQRSYGGPPSMGPAWAETIALDELRRLFLTQP